MKDINGKEIVVGCVVKEVQIKPGYTKIFHIGKENMITNWWNETLEIASKNEKSVSTLSIIKRHNLKVVQYPKLGVKDKNGKELRMFDEINLESCSMVACGISQILNVVKYAKSEIIVTYKNESREDFVCYSSRNATFVSRPTDEPKVEVSIKVNGKEIDEPLSIETAKRLGVVE